MKIRRTVARPSSRFFGVGLHSGSPSWLQVLPAECSGAGILFRNYSTCGEVKASIASLASTNRSTSLASEAARVDTVEHVLSALYGCEITDAVVLYDGLELPIGDGSSDPFVQMIDDAGVMVIDGEVEELTIDREVVVRDRSGSVMTAVPSDNFWIVASIDYANYPAIGVQSAAYRCEDYRTQVAPARTYGFYHELDALRAAGLAKGAALDNVVALGEFGDPDPETPLRMKDELVRHKILDMIGDLCLLQRDLKIGIVALKPSHTINTRMCAALLGIGKD